MTREIEITQRSTTGCASSGTVGSTITVAILIPKTKSTHELGADVGADAVVWLGDFNYRIGLSSENARSLIKKGDLETLYENDQVSKEYNSGVSHQRADFLVVEPANDRRACVSLLLRGPYQFPAYI